MREIIFRGKRADNGEWVQAGNLIHFNNEGIEQHYYIPKYNDKCVCTHDDNNNILAIEKGTFYKVIPETVGQYTGLTDKNGKKIFEGDIVKGEFFGFPMPFEDYVFAIGWQEDVAGYRANYFGNVEIIGNIHDNPELLKGGADNGNL